MANLACTYSDQGKWNEAEQLEVEVLNMRKKLLGAEHPDTLLSMENLARIYANKGNLKEAEQLEIEVLDMKKKLFAEHISKTHPYLVNTFSTFQYMLILFILVTTLVFFMLACE